MTASGAGLARCAPRRCSSLGFGLLLVSLAACRGSHGERADAAAPPPSLAATATSRDSPRAHDELWSRAGESDPADLARLADREGAGGLLEGLEEGGKAGLTALLALPYAEDGELAYARLAEILRQLQPAASGPVVAAVRALAQTRRRQTEPLDPPGMRACGDALLDLARDTHLAPAVRAPAIAAARLLVERHAVDPRAIPADLDAR